MMNTRTARLSILLGALLLFLAVNCSCVNTDAVRSVPAPDPIWFVPFANSAATSATHGETTAKGVSSVVADARWSINLVPYSNLSHKASFQLNEPMILAGDLLFVRGEAGKHTNAGTMSGGVFCIDCKTGRKVWEWSIKGAKVRAARRLFTEIDSLGYASGRVIASCVLENKRFIVGLDAFSGSEEWRCPIRIPFKPVDTPRYLTDTIVISRENEVVALTGQHTISILDPDEGRTINSIATDSDCSHVKQILKKDGLILLVSPTRMTAINEQGQSLWSVPRHETFWSNQNVSTLLLNNKVVDVCWYDSSNDHFRGPADLRALSIEDGHELWVRNFPGRTIGRVASPSGSYSFLAGYQSENSGFVVFDDVDLHTNETGTTPLGQTLVIEAEGGTTVNSYEINPSDKTDESIHGFNQRNNDNLRVIDGTSSKSTTLTTSTLEPHVISIVSLLEQKRIVELAVSNPVAMIESEDKLFIYEAGGTISCYRVSRKE